MTTEDLAYAAGIVDGEGCISLVHHSRQDGYVLRVSVAMKGQVLPWFKETFGGDIGPNQPGLNVWNLNRKRDQKTFLNQILPYLKHKMVQAEIALAFIETLETRELFDGRRTPDTTKLIQERLYLAMVEEKAKWNASHVPIE